MPELAVRVVTTHPDLRINCFFYLIKRALKNHEPVNRARKEDPQATSDTRGRPSTFRRSTPSNPFRITSPVAARHVRERLCVWMFQHREEWRASRIHQTHQELSFSQTTCPPKVSSYRFEETDVPATRFPMCTRLQFVPDSVPQRWYCLQLEGRTF